MLYSCLFVLFVFFALALTLSGEFIGAGFCGGIALIIALLANTCGTRRRWV
jgi:hypothetical protein